MQRELTNQSPATQRRVIIFSDLDGTFLDHHTYSFEALQPALRLVKTQAVPLIFCSSKTRREIEAVQKEAGIGDPFIVENGAALFIPKDYFAFEIPGAARKDSYWVCEMGTAYDKLVQQLRRLSRETGVPVIGFADISVQQVAAECNLSVEQAALAKMREYDEPFKIVDENSEARAKLTSAIVANGLRCMRGGRFFHLTGKNDKGEAVRRMTRFFEHAFGGVLTIGIGDSHNDLDMLRAAEVPVLVQKPGRRYDDETLKQFPDLWLAQEVGPVGWNESVIALLNKFSVL